jgi:hypothetical protein
MLRLYFIGISILAIAIAANIFTSKAGIASWYDFLKLLAEKGTNAFAQLRLVDYFWLLIVYPLVLAFGYKLGDWLYHTLLPSGNS